MTAEVEHGEERVDGVRVELARPRDPGARRRPPLVFVHGGDHGSWCWERFLPYFAERGWECAALNWYGHHGSRELPKDEFVRRSIADVREEIGLVVRRLGRPPVLVAHSMGGLAAQKYAETAEVAALVLLAPVAPAEVGGPPIEVPYDPDEPWGPPPLEVARELFFQGATEEEARRYHALLCPESPRAVEEATRWSLSVDRAAVDAPMLVFGAEDDRLVPPDVARRVAEHYGGEYVHVAGRGHNLLLEPRWEETAGRIAAWLDERFPGPAPT